MENLGHPFFKTLLCYWNLEEHKDAEQAELQKRQLLPQEQQQHEETKKRDMHLRGTSETFRLDVTKYPHRVCPLTSLFHSLSQLKTQYHLIPLKYNNEFNAEKYTTHDHQNVHTHKLPQAQDK
jgi:hypothetical protein